MSVQRERAATLLHEMRSAGCTFTLSADGPRVRFSADCPSTPQLLQYIRENREAVVELLRAEEGLAPEPAAAVTPPALAPVAQPPAAPEQRSAKPEPAAVLVCGASKWPAGRVGVILDRLGRLPKDTRVIIHGDTEARNRKGPVGAAAIARAAMALGAGVPVVTVAAGDLDAALARVGRVIVFHADPNSRTATAAVVARAKALGLPVEVITGHVSQEAAR